MTAQARILTTRDPKPRRCYTHTASRSRHLHMEVGTARNCSCQLYLAAPGNRHHRSPRDQWGWRPNRQLVQVASIFLVWIITQKPQPSQYLKPSFVWTLFPKPQPMIVGMMIVGMTVAIRIVIFVAVAFPVEIGLLIAGSVIIVYAAGAVAHPRLQLPIKITHHNTSPLTTPGPMHLQSGVTAQPGGQRWRGK